MFEGGARGRLAAALAVRVDNAMVQYFLSLCIIWPNEVNVAYKSNIVSRSKKTRKYRRRYEFSTRVQTISHLLKFRCRRGGRASARRRAFSVINAARCAWAVDTVDQLFERLVFGSPVLPQRDVVVTPPLCARRPAMSVQLSKPPAHTRRMLRLEVTLKKCNDDESPNERGPPNALSALSHSTMIGLPRAQH
ncbi:hypothetical protein EVAR_38437_1 [Eumeta japonica]|uniref:Uncharacterized protein n=1 Tax=Eumeta variegata TaxID=151549 RepID=A0A4C1WY93_EUMVA|nr:hypothetical protein EVAR_38437_1 [Eumeta japonica]